MIRFPCFVLAFDLLLAGAAWAADGSHWKPDYSSPAATVLTQCMAQNLPEGRKEIMARAFVEGDSLPDSMLGQKRVMCRVTEVKPVHGAVHPSVVLPDLAQVILEEWDPLDGDAGTTAFRRWFAVRKVGKDWKITDWGDVNDEDNPLDDMQRLPAVPDAAGEGK